MIPKKILFSTDFSENSIPARKCAEEYSKAFGAELSILHVVNTSGIGYPSLEEGVPVDIRVLVENMQRSVDKALALLAAELGGAAFSVKTFSRIGGPAQEIVRFASEQGMDLIIMGTHGRTGIKHLIMGSTAENVVRTADCPVLTVRRCENDPGAEIKKASA